MDYRLLSVLALLCWGAWGFLGKILSRDTPIGALVLWTNLGGLLPIIVYVASQAKHGLGITGRGACVMALIAGFLGTAASIFFYLALKGGPTSVVVPLSGMYIVVPAILGLVFLHEAVTVQHVAGIACACVAVFLLSR